MKIEIYLLGTPAMTGTIELPLTRDELAGVAFQTIELGTERKKAKLFVRGLSLEPNGRSLLSLQLVDERFTREQVAELLGLQPERSQSG